MAATISGILAAMNPAVPPLNQLHDRDLVSDPDYLAEDMALDLTEDISRILQFRGLTRADLSRAMGVSRSYITRMLGSPPNMTLRTIAAAGIALGVRPRIVFPHNIESKYQKYLWEETRPNNAASTSDWIGQVQGGVIYACAPDASRNRPASPKPGGDTQWTG